MWPTCWHEIRIDSIIIGIFSHALEAKYHRRRHRRRRHHHHHHHHYHHHDHKRLIHQKVEQRRRCSLQALVHHPSATAGR